MNWTPAFASLIITASLFGVGCSRQAEGERCSLENGNIDCEGSLVCTDHNKLRKGPEDGVDRCCPEELGSSDTPECAQRINSDVGDGDSGGDGGSGPGGSSNAGDSNVQTPDELGDSCDYNSDCSAPLICGPSGKCQFECRTDRDCPSDQICSTELSCVSN